MNKIQSDIDVYEMILKKLFEPKQGININGYRNCGPVYQLPHLVLFYILSCHDRYHAVYNACFTTEPKYVIQSFIPTNSLMLTGQPAKQ